MKDTCNEQRTAKDINGLCRSAGHRHQAQADQNTGYVLGVVAMRAHGFFQCDWITGVPLSFKAVSNHIQRQ